MDLWATGLVSLLLLACAGGLIYAHVQTWRRAVACAPTREELDFRRRQFRRRTQTSAMMAVLAIALFVGQWLTGMVESPWFAVVYWLAVLIVVGWVGLLALVDILATKLHYDRVRQGYVLERFELEAKLRKVQRARGNGQSADDADKTE